MKKKENHLSTRQNDCDSYTSRSVTTESVLLRTVSVLSYNILLFQEYPDYKYRPRKKMKQVPGSPPSKPAKVGLN